MATIYRIAIEQTTKSQSDGRKGGNRAGTGKKSTAKTTDLLVGSRGGVEHNRRMRAINPVLNKATHGYWEKGMRLGRAGMGIASTASAKGIGAVFGSVGFAIIIAFILQVLMKWQNKERQNSQKLNAQNYKMLENGVGAINGVYQVESNFWTGRQTYNQNK